MLRMRWIIGTAMVLAFHTQLPTNAADPVEPRPPILVTPDLKTNVDASFRGLAVRNANEAWASGTDNVVIRTMDGGRTWDRVQAPGEEGLDFRDVEVFDDGSVLLMSVGEGASSQIFRSTDEGKTWRRTLQNLEAKGFFDGFAFHGKNGILYGDPIDGRMEVHRTMNAGASWTRLPTEQRPKLLQGEYGFAASGTGIAVDGPNVWIATGGAAARVHHSPDFGRTWNATKTGVRSGNPSSGIFSIAFRDSRIGIVVGGDYLKPGETEHNVAITTDDAKRWKTVDAAMPHKACVRFLNTNDVLACGRTGIMFSPDRGLTWQTVSDRSFYTFDYDAESAVGFLAGKDGRIARFSLTRK